jgi:hypothetical protein
MRCRRRPTLPRPLGRSTIGAVGLNDRVRDGNGCGPYALVASENCGSSIVLSGTRHGVLRRAAVTRSVDRRTDRSVGSGTTISTMLTADDGRSWTTNPETMCCSACSLLYGSSQATRAIRTAALGVGCPTSTGGLLTGWSPPALQEARSLGSVHLGACFPLRCVQRLSQPFIATRRCPWQDSRDTSGTSDPVLSY